MRTKEENGLKTKCTKELNVVRQNGELFFFCKDNKEILTFPFSCKKCKGKKMKINVENWTVKGDEEEKEFQVHFCVVNELCFFW